MTKDEDIREAIIELVRGSGHILNPMKQKAMIGWIEKQGKQPNKVATKFNVGDFIVSDYCMGKVIELTNDAYLLDSGQGIPFSCEHNAHLWTIQDAKDGDVLSTKDAVFIFKHMDKAGLSLCKSYCEVIGDSKLGLGFDFSIDSVHPAAKEQRNILFQKMKEAGYEWNATSKELKTVERDLMERPSDESVRKAYSGLLRLDDALQHTFYGSQMHDSKFHGGEDTWSFPEGVREKLKDNERYRVWYTRHDAADPCDTSSHYCVYYIKKI